MKTLERQKTIRQLIERRHKIDVATRQQEVYRDHGLLTDLEFEKIALSFYTNDEKLSRSYDHALKQAIDDGICPMCGGQLKIIEENTGFDESPHIDVRIVCVNCGGDI